MGRDALEVVGGEVDWLLEGKALTPGPGPHPRPLSPTDQGRGERRSRRTPHEADRATRRVEVSFPDGAWVDALNERAARWGLRVSDLLVYLAAEGMGRIESGELGKPVGETRFYHRGGEGLALPWEPG